MANERNTENIFRRMLSNKGFTSDNGYTVEEQSSKNPIIQKLLSKASKSGDGQGYPEFIITHKDYLLTNPIVIIVECKAETKFHESKDKDKYKDYAVDGVLLYATHLSKEFNVISIALSGEDEGNHKFSSFYTIKGNPNHRCIYRGDKGTVNDLLSIKEYDEEVIHTSIEKQNADLVAIINLTRIIHDYIYSNVAITEEKKSLLVSGIILGLENKEFRDTFKTTEESSKGNVSKNKLCKNLIDAIQSSLEETGMPVDKINSMVNVFRFITTDKNILLKINPTYKTSHLYWLISEIYNIVTPFLKKYTDVDVIGHFYNEFIRYTGGDSKGLGIVLTPKHVTEFMCELIQINKDSVVLDTCTGTGGFLISAMNRMLNEVKDSPTMTDEQKKEKQKQIKSTQLIGVEQQPFIYTMAASNMYFKGDGKTNLLLGSCFDLKDELKVEIKDSNGNVVSINNPNKALINPPYAQKNDSLKEIDFIQFTLDSLEIGGQLACIVPMSTAINTRVGILEKREKLLSKHRLDAVFSMPNDLFSPQASVNTCIIVMTAHIPHNSNDHHKTYFGYLKDDGFKITKKGRIDTGKWKGIEKNHLSLYFNKEQKSGLSVNKKVSASDEWCAEAYLDYDYSTLKEEDFEEVVRKYIAYQVINKKGGSHD